MIRAAYEIPSVHIALWAARKPLTIDFNDPEHSGGKWLNVYRAAREALRRAAVKAAKKVKKPKN
jgi:hypothetical protein